MFVRLKNVLDYDVMKNDLSKDINCTKVMDRLREALQVLDDSYGADRSSRDMGGYVFLFTVVLCQDLVQNKMRGFAS